jgi:hypothetical protein
MLPIYQMPSTGFTNEYLDTILDSIDDHLYPVNTFIAYHLLNKNYSYLKTLPKSSEITVERYAQLTSELTINQVVVARAFANDLFNTNHTTYAFFGSKKLFKTIAFDSFLPSDYENIISQLTKDNYLKIVGQGSGSVVLFNTHKLDEPFTVNSFSNSDSFQSSISSFIDSFNLTKIDNQYLLNLLSEKDIYINSLLEQMQDLKTENYQVSQMTWR